MSLLHQAWYLVCSADRDVVRLRATLTLLKGQAARCRDHEEAGDSSQSDSRHRQGRHHDSRGPAELQVHCESAGVTESNVRRACLTGQIREVVKAQNIKIYSPPIDSEEPQAAEHAQALRSVMPFSIIGSIDDVTTPDGRVVKGREYLWGVAEGRPSQPYKRAAETVLTRA